MFAGMAMASDSTRARPGAKMDLVFIGTLLERSP
jgi:hypothetical protein